MTTAATASQSSSTTQVPPLDQTTARNERLNPNDNGPWRPGRRGRGGNRGGSGNVNTSRNQPLFHGRGRGRGGGAPGHWGTGRGTGTGTGTAPGRRRGTGRGRGDSPNTTRTVAGMGRSFGGRLTREEPEAVDDVRGDRSLVQEDQGSLRANAPEFVPGAQLPPSTSTSMSTSTPRPAPIRERTRQPRPTKAKSTADNIATRIHEDIAHSLYECPICTSELGRKTRVWSCSLCWTVFHLSCIKKWSNNEGSALARPRQQQGHEDGQDHPRQWRCPGCNLPHDILPSTYTCWCEKETDPRPLPGLPPHSCGQSCSKARKGCPHPCDSVCHAGPCPPCTAMGPAQFCFCGRHESTKKCVDTDYENGWSCQEPCGELLPCLEHACARSCHEGLCGACEEIIDARCYCGKSRTKMMCSNREEEKHSGLIIYGEDGSPEETVQEWVGCFDCREICNRAYDCGIHTCQKRCHPQDAAVPHCPGSPDVITHCACGKTPLSVIPEHKPRTSCEDPIPNCKEPCGRLLPCQHECPVLCHTGPCPPCFLRVSISCRCGKSAFQTICHQGAIEPPQCFRVCKATMNCGRHTCGERCCPGERKAIERQATKRKLKSLNVVVNRPNDDDIEAEHICTRLCGRMLKCSKHTCEELCHKGSCGTCREAVFEEISCNCGRSVLYPPLPCGTQPPPCHYECARPKSCGHPQTSHNCHTDDESCPKCPFLTEKRCLCAKKTLKNQPCWLTDPRCGLVCGKELKCGSHTCKNHCHRPGECEDSTEPCHQPCGKIKRLCSHPCSDPCHAPFPCLEKSPCQSLISITCPCGRLKQEKRCNASRDNKNRLQHQQQSQSPSPLKCDDECGRLQRNRSLASALNISIDPLTTSATADGTSATTSASLPAAPASPRLPPTPRLIHSLAADWGFQSESYDPEPHRHVAIFKTAHWVPPHGLGAGVDGAVAVASAGIGIGGVSVGECAKMRERARAKEREAQRAAAAAAAAAQKSRAESRTVLNDEGGEGGSDAATIAGGWAQVASRKRPTTLPAESAFGFGEIRVENGRGGFGGSGAGGKGGTLVLRSGVGVFGKGKAGASGSGSGGADASAGAGDWRKFPAGFADDVVDDWEEEVEKEGREGMDRGHLDMNESNKVEVQAEGQGEV
ncbi:hypothetical protein ACJ72_06432 [Emergomyces africanus]|uniref:R3H domain-containing protein n=1 Tax=Emergomyces africanus TaxID=1955775 RepID=A0A1B7NR23_9EURO|nr:hypothetical protein ACJ72_06432 [Emergomyces africanus]